MLTSNYYMLTNSIWITVMLTVDNHHKVGNEDLWENESVDREDRGEQKRHREVGKIITEILTMNYVTTDYCNVAMLNR